MDHRRSVTRALRGTFSHATFLRTYAGPPAWQNISGEITFDADLDETPGDQERVAAWVATAEAAQFNVDIARRSTRMTITLTQGA